MKSVHSKFHLNPQLSTSETEETEVEMVCRASLVVCERHLMPRGSAFSLRPLRKTQMMGGLPAFTLALPGFPIYVYLCRIPSMCVSTYVS